MKVRGAEAEEGAAASISERKAVRSGATDTASEARGEFRRSDE